MTGLRTHDGIRIRRLRLRGDDRAYDVDFRAPDDAPRPLSILAGAFSTGKTTILEFVDYCLGANDHPRHPEITPKVKSATLEVELSGSPYLIERAVGEPSMFAYVRAGRLDDPGAAPRVRRPLRPAGHPESLSSLLLSHCKLQGVRLSFDTHDPLSFRDLMWLCFLPNERLDGKDLLFESVPMKHLKLRQVVDVVFDVHDDHTVEIGRRIRTIEAELAAARTAYRAAEQLVEEQHVGSRADLEALHISAKEELSACAQALADLDARTRAGTGFAAELRERHREAARAALVAYTDLRDRETQLQRMTPLRGSYADDVSKWTMLAEADRLFETAASVCASCQTPLDADDDERCPACRFPITPVDVSGELRSARTRLAELSRYVEELEREIPRLRSAASRAQEAESRAAAELDALTAHAVTPFLAERDAIARRREEAAATLQRAAGGLRLVQGLERRAAGIAQMLDQ
ncbi:DNA recombination protein RecN, partial [Dactylosporangium sp. NPDC000555]|uniref:DNA recombination protein RecN n=1 Tax=Dactylosporangium sp. NPDC000555 TaxID=3154260 RepID=UPI00332772ED